MANIKIVLDTRRAKVDSTYNIIFRVSHCRQVYTLNTGVSILENYWNAQDLQIDKSHPNSKLLNLKISKDYFKTQEALLRLGDGFTIEKLRSLIDGKPVTDNVDTFKEFADKLILQMMQTNKTGNALVYQTAVNKFIEFYGSDIQFKSIDYSLLDRFTHQLTLNGLKQNSISNYFRTIRAIYNKAIKQKIVERSFYPFHDITVKSEVTTKRAILREDILNLIAVPVKQNSASWKALNYFLLSYYLIGMSFTDLAYLKAENVIDGRVVYRRRKTHKTYSVKLFPVAEKILLSFHKERSKYLLPILHDGVPENSLKAKRTIQQWIKTTNKYLKRLSNDAGINGTVTTYVARHTFATTAKRLGYPNELIAEALGHEYGNKITNIYLDSFDRKVVDEMHRTVILSLEHQKVL